MAELREQYEIENNTLLSFIEECCDRVTLLATRRLKKTEFKRVYYRWVDYNNGGKGKLKNKEIEDTLKNRYEFKIKKYDGYDQIEGLIIKDETYRELGLSNWEG
jgi:phage/plasmid-associated DNA primase